MNSMWSPALALMVRLLSRTTGLASDSAIATAAPDSGTGEGAVSDALTGAGMAGERSEGAAMVAGGGVPADVSVAAALFDATTSTISGLSDTEMVAEAASLISWMAQIPLSGSNTLISVAGVPRVSVTSCGSSASFHSESQKVPSDFSMSNELSLAVVPVSQ